MSNKGPACASCAAGEDHRFSRTHAPRLVSRSGNRSSPKGPAISSGGVTAS